MKLRVMHIDGGPASATAIAGRTLLRIIDSHIGMFVVLLTGHRRQRIGDVAASTVVRVDDRPYAPLPHSPLTTVFPALVLGTALISAWQLGLFHPGHHSGTTAKRTSDPYMTQVDQICERRVRQENAIKSTETIDQVQGYSVAETQAIKELPPPPPASRRAYNSVLEWKHRLDAVGGQVVADVQRSTDPEATMNAEIRQWKDVGSAANERFIEYGLPYCAH